MSNLNFNNMRRLLSFLCLFVIGWGSAWATVPLTRATYNNPSACQLNLNSAQGGYGTIYGDPSVNEANYADLSNYSALKLINVSTSGAWRLVFNRVGSGNDYVEILANTSNPTSHNNKYYEWEWGSNGVNITIDLNLIKEENGNVHLNCIKNQDGHGDLTIQDIQLVKKYPEVWDFTTWRTTLSGSGWTANYANSHEIKFKAYALHQGEIVTGSTGDNAHNDYQVGTVVEETAGLIFGANAGEIRVITDGTGLGVRNTSAGAQTITIPDLQYGNVVKFTFGDQPGRIFNDYGLNVSELANKTITFEVPNTVTSPTNIVFSFQGTGTQAQNLDVKIKQIRVERSEINAMFDFYQRRNSSNGGWEDNQLNSHQIPYGADYNNKTARVRLQIQPANDIKWNMLCDGTSVDNFGSNDINPNVNSTFFNRYFSLESTNPDVFDFSTNGRNGIKANLNGNKEWNMYLQDLTILNSGTTTLILKFKGSNAFEPFSVVYTATVVGTQNQSNKLIWLSVVNPKTGSPLGGSYRGNYWTQKNIMYFDQIPLHISEVEDRSQFNLVTTMPYGNNLLVNASAFTSLAWMQEYAEHGFTGKNDKNDNVEQKKPTNPLWIMAMKGDQGANANGTLNANAVPMLNPVSGLMDYPTFWMGEENGFGSGGYNWRYWMALNYITNDNRFSYTPASTAYPKLDGSGTKNLKNVITQPWMNGIQYSVNHPELLDSYSKGEQIGGATYDEETGKYMRTGNGDYKVYNIAPYPILDADGNLTGDSIEVIATIPGGGDLNPVEIRMRVLVTKGHYDLSFSPSEGTVTKNNWVIPYVNIPDTKLKDIKRITCWIDDANVATVAFQYKYEEDGTVKYVLYEEGVATETEWIHTKYDKESGLWFVDQIYPKITGLKAGDHTKIHLRLESDYYDITDGEYTVHVIDNNKPAFHFVMYDDGAKTQTMTLQDKADLRNVQVKYGNDLGDTEGIIRTINMVEGDFIYMPGIVGTANGNDEYSRSFLVFRNESDVDKQGKKYAYVIKEGQLEMNWDPYFWREGVPNYFISTGYSGSNGNFQPTGIISPVNGDVSGYPAIIYKEKYNNESPRLDTLMIYANNPTTSSLYLWAQDPQTHLCCTPIRLNILSKASVYDNPKASYLGNMSYPYTWDFEHMDMTNIKADAEQNLGSYWELERGGTDTDGNTTNADHYQANGFFNADHDDKNGNGHESENYSGEGNEQGVDATNRANGIRQRWFKDLSANGVYMPQFYGLMLNIAGLDYWNQKYGRFIVHKDGKYIKFVGGPHFLQLPGFGIKPENVDTKDDKGRDITDGTRNNNNLIGKLHNKVNTISYSAAPAGSGHADYDYVSTGSNMYNSATDFTTDLTSGNPDIIDQTYKKRNHKVRFIIKAAGGRQTVNTKDVYSGNNQSSQIHIGGKSMIQRKLEQNRIEWGANNNKIALQNHGYSQYNVKYINDTPDRGGEIYVFELDPYDPEFQDHIYLMFNNDVYVYWMAITSEARDLRSDYDNFTYSYPKDIDMDKTNQLMKVATATGIAAKNPNNLNQTYMAASAGNDGATTFVPKYGIGKELTLNAYSVTGFRRDAEALTLAQVPNERFARDEGVIIYPSEKISTMSLPNSGMEQITTTQQVATWDGQTYKTETVQMQDGNDHTYVYPVFTMKNQEHKFQYLPVYFVANAENMADYEGKSTVAKAANGYAKTATQDYAADFEGYGRVPLLNGGDAPVAPVSVAADGDTHMTNYNGSKNLLRPSTYTTYVGRDYGTAENENANRWVNLVMANEFIWRNLMYDDLKTLNKSLAVGDMIYGDTDDQGNQINQPYYELRGPEYVRFYRSNKDENLRNRRAYLSLTWNEYNVDTYGKGGVAYGGQTGGADNWPAPGVIVVPNWNGQGTPPTGWPNMDPSFSKGYSVFLSFNNPEGEDVVSEDGGFPDGIQEVTNDSGDKVFYNLNGIRVNTPSKGVYILNGKKVIVK